MKDKITTITEIYIIKTVVDAEAEEYGTSSVTVSRLTDVDEDIVNVLARKLVAEIAKTAIKIPCVFPESPKDWGKFTVSFIPSDCDKALMIHHVADTDEDEWTEVKKE